MQYCNGVIFFIDSFWQYVDRKQDKRGGMTLGKWTRDLNKVSHVSASALPNVPGRLPVLMRFDDEIVLPANYELNQPKATYVS